MRVRRVMAIVLAVALGACAYGVTPNVRSPLGADLSAAATTGAPVPLRVDPDAKVILTNTAGLPPASFLASQAKRGGDIYESSCGRCHAPDEHVGEAFVASWNNRRVYDLYALIRATMPLDSAGGLKDGEYLDVVAYLLQANHQAAPSQDSLRGDTATLRHSRIAIHFP